MAADLFLPCFIYYIVLYFKKITFVINFLPENAFFPLLQKIQQKGTEQLSFCWLLADSVPVLYN